MHGAQPPTTRTTPSGVTRPGEVGAAGGGGQGVGGQVVCVCVARRPVSSVAAVGEPGRARKVSGPPVYLLLP